MGLRILHLVPSIPFGGMQRLVASLAAEQIRQGLDVLVGSIYEDSRFGELLASKNVPFETLGGNRPSLRAAFTLSRLLNRYSPKIVHLHAALLWTNLVGWVCKKEPWIYHAHTYPKVSPTTKSRLVDCVTSRLCDVQIAVSESVSKQMLHHQRNRSRAFVVHNGIDWHAGSQPIRRAFCEESPVFGTAMRMVMDKGLHAFVKVAREISTRQPSARFVVAGDGPDIADFESELASQGLSEVVKILGHVTDMNNFWSKIDVFLFVSPRDTFGLTIVEAMACGVPVAAYRTGAGSDEILRDGETGLMAEYGDAKGLAHQAIQFVLERPLRERVSQHGFDNAKKKYTIRVCAQGINEVYSNVLSHRT